MNIKLLISILITLVSAFSPLSVFAESRVLLTLTYNHGFTKTFTREALQALPQSELTTETPWTKGNNIYQGPQLSTILDFAPNGFSTFRVYALNEYSYEITKADLKKYQFILAIKENGKAIRIRDKGPLWILIPFSKYPEIKTGDEILNQLVWQLNRIEII